MGWKNRKIEYIKKENIKTGWKIMNKYSLELKNLIDSNKNNLNLYLILCQINGKFYSELKSNKLNFNDKKYYNVWNSIFNRMLKVSNNRNEVIFNINQLYYISNKKI